MFLESYESLPALSRAMALTLYQPGASARMSTALLKTPFVGNSTTMTGLGDPILDISSESPWTARPSETRSPTVMASAATILILLYPVGSSW